MRRAIVVPGRHLGPWAPLLLYAGRAAEQRGAQVRALTWDEADLDAAASSGASASEWVGGRVRAALQDAPAETVVIGKSLATWSGAVVAEHAVPAVWLTPLLREPDVVAGLRAARAPFLLVGGSADVDAWDRRIAASLTPHVHEVAGADHGLMLPGPLVGSAAALGQVATAVEQFLDHVVWPP